MSKKLTLDEVLDAFAAAADRPSEALVREWSEKYPEFEREIVEFAVEWVATNLSWTEAGLNAEQADLLVTRTMSHVQQVDHLLRLEAGGVPAAIPASPTAGQLDRVEAAFRARSIQSSWPATLGIDDTILALFEEHMISPPVPGRLLDAFSTALKMPMEAVKTWLFQDARPAMASYASKLPTFKHWTFQQAVENSTLSDEDKQQWLREPA